MYCTGSVVVGLMHAVETPKSSVTFYSCKTCTVYMYMYMYSIHVHVQYTCTCTVYMYMYGLKSNYIIQCTLQARTFVHV